MDAVSELHDEKAQEHRPAAVDGVGRIADIGGLGTPMVGRGRLVGRTAARPRPT
jgi:hypothetical protein